MRKVVMIVVMLCVLMQGCALFVDGAIKRDISATYAVTKAQNEERAAGTVTPEDDVKLLQELEKHLQLWMEYCYGKNPESEVK